MKGHSVADEYMFEDAQRVFCTDSFVSNGAFHIIVTNFEITSLLQEEQIETLCRFVRWLESELALVFRVNFCFTFAIIIYTRNCLQSDNPVVISHNVTHRTLSCVLLLVKFKEYCSLVKLENFTIYVDMVFRGPVLASVLWADSLLHNDTEWVTIYRFPLHRAKVKLHAIDVMAAILVCSQETFLLTTTVLFSLKSVRERFEGDAGALPSVKCIMLGVSERLRPIMRLMGAIESCWKLEELHVYRDTRSRFATQIWPIEVDLHIRHVEREVSTNFSHIFLDHAELVLLLRLLHVLRLIIGVDADDLH